MGSPSGGVGGSGGGSSAGGGGGVGGSSGGRGSDNDRGGISDGGSDRSESKSESSQSGMTGSERTAGSPSFGDALSDAVNSRDDGGDDSDRSESKTESGGGISAADRAAGHHAQGALDAAGDAFGSLADPSDDTADRAAEEAAQAAARDHHPASEFSGLGPSGGPVDNSMPGDDSLNSHRGYGPDGMMAGGIDDDVNAGLEAANPAGFDRSLGLDIAGYGAAGAAGGYGMAGQYANIQGINTVADTLGRHPTANLPTHPGSTVSNADYAADLSKQKTAAKALANHPAQGGAMRGVLEDAASTASRYGRVSAGIGLAFDPVVTGTAAAVNTEGDWTDKATAAFMEGAKRVDNAVVSFGAGAAAAGATMLGTGGTATIAAPGVGAAAGVAAGEAYSRVGPDAWVDRQIERARPGVEAMFDGIDSAVDTSVEIAHEIGDQVSQGVQAIMDAVSSDEDESSFDPGMNVAP